MHFGLSAKRFIRRGNHIEALLTDNGELEADEYVLAAGAWSRDLARSMGHRLPLLAGKGYGFNIQPSQEKMVRPSILVEARVAMTPMHGTIRCVGTMEIGQPNQATNVNRVSGLKSSINSYYPTLNVPPQEEQVWVGNRPCSPDGMPYIGRSRNIGNLVFATGHAMMGMSLGPITGQLVSQIISDQSTSFKLNLVSPDRYA
jgi:D-amino-acid dehydrogenase